MRKGLGRLGSNARKRQSKLGQRFLVIVNADARLIALVNITLSLPCGERKRHNSINVKFWEVIADNLSKADWSWGCVARPAAA